MRIGRGWSWLGVVCLAGCATTSDPASQASSAVAAAAEEPAAGGPVIQVGVSAAEINPSAGAMLAGYGYNRRCTGVHDPLYAKAVVFDDGTTPVALVVVDAYGLQYTTVQEIRAAAVQKLGDFALPPERILVQSTHTHCAPDTVGLWGADPTVSGVNPEYMAKLVATAADQVARAVARREPALVLQGRGECRGWVVNRSQPAELDTSVDVLQCVDEDGENMVTLTHFACTPAVLGSKTTLVSADFVGAFYRSMEATLGGEHVFLQGATGGWVQPVEGLANFPQAREYGVDLASTVVDALANAKPIRDTAIRFNRKVFTIPVANEHFKEMTAAGIMLRPYAETIETEVAWFAIGPIQFATHPGEPVPELGWATEQLMDTGPKFVLGFGSDAVGFLLPSEFFEANDIPHADYLVSMSPGPEAAGATMQALREIVP